MRHARSHLWSSIVISGLAVTLSGCPRPADDAAADPPSGELASYSVCVREETCAEREQACVNRVNADCSECYSYLAGGFIGDCSRICDSSYCDRPSCEGTICAESEQRFTPAERDEQVFASCIAARQREAVCTGITEDTMALCDVFARREGSWVTAIYDCVAATACDGDTTPCFAALPREGLAAHVLGQFEFACSRAPDGSWEYWDANDGWLKPAYRDALETCLEMGGCDAMSACIAALDAACTGS